MKINKKDKRNKRVTLQVKKNNKGRKPILYVFRSNKNISVQIIDVDGKVLVTSYSKDLGSLVEKKSGIETASIVGKDIASKALAKGIKEVVFNKGPYIYIGRIKALAESARENGLKF